MDTETNATTLPSMWCHACQRTFQPTATDATANETTLTCSRCGGDFVEMIESEDDPRPFYHTGFGMGSENGMVDVEGLDDGPGGAAGSQDVMNMFQTILTQLLPQQPQQPHQPQQQQQQSSQSQSTTTGYTSSTGNTGSQFDSQFGPVHFSFSVSTSNGGINTQTHTFNPSNNTDTNNNNDTINNNDQPDGNGQPRGNQVPLNDFNDFLGLLLRNQMNAMNMDGGDAGRAFGGGLFRMMGMAGNHGDYVFGQQGLDDIISQMMEQTAGRNAPPPAAEDIIASLPQSKISVEEAESKLDCSICQDEFEPGEVVTMLPVCHHRFHPDCVKQWLQINGTCPVCRCGLQAETQQQQQSRQ